MKKQLLFALTLLVGQICFAGQSKTKTCDNNSPRFSKTCLLNCLDLEKSKEVQKLS